MSIHYYVVRKTPAPVNRQAEKLTQHDSSDFNTLKTTNSPKPLRSNFFRSTLVIHHSPKVSGEWKRGEGRGGIGVLNYLKFFQQDDGVAQTAESGKSQSVRQKVWGNMERSIKKWMVEQSRGKIEGKKGKIQNEGREARRRWLRIFQGGGGCVCVVVVFPRGFSLPFGHRILRVVASTHLVFLSIFTTSLPPTLSSQFSLPSFSLVG